jgi:hemoglobin-like flavoprotein
MDTQLLRANYQTVTANGDDVAAYFYADLFNRRPDYRSMFPSSMTRQNELLIAALTHIVDVMDDLESLLPFLTELGKKHQGFGVTTEHYQEVTTSLVGTLEYFTGPGWNQELKEGWTTAVGLAADVMSQPA